MPFDLLQVILVLTIVIITALLTVLGIEVFYILKDVRKMLDRVNGVIGDAEHVVNNVKKPTEMIAGVAHSAELLSKLFEMVKSHEDSKQAPMQIVVEEKPRVSDMREEIRQPIRQESEQPSMPKPMTLGRRFFRMPRRSGS